MIILSFRSDKKENNKGKEKKNNRATCEYVNEGEKAKKHASQRNISQKLVVIKVLKKRFQIPDQARDHHIYNRTAYPFKREQALEIS